MTAFIPATTISPLRQRLIDDMNMRRFSPETQRNYIRDVGRFAAFLGRRPDTATAEDLRRFQIEQRDGGVPTPTMNSIVSALRFFFTHTVDRPDLARKLVRVLGTLFRRLFLTRLIGLHQAGKLAFFGALADLTDRRRFLHQLAPVRNKRWVVYAKPPFAGPEAVLAYLARYTHRVAISNRRLIAFDQAGVTFRYKDYRRTGPERQQVMTLAAHEFMRRFLLHVLPRGFHRIRHYGPLAGATRKASIARARELLAVAPPSEPAEPMEAPGPTPPCPCCGGRMRVIESFGRWCQPRAPPQAHAPTGMVPS